MRQKEIDDIKRSHPFMRMVLNKIDRNNGGAYYQLVHYIPLIY